MFLSRKLIRLLGVLFILTCVATTLPAQAPHGAPPAITVETDSGISLLYDMGLNTWNGAIFDRTPTDAFFYMRQSGASIPFVPLGDTIHITFDGDPPDGWTLYDRIEGLRRGEQILAIDFNDNTASFLLEPFPEDQARTLDPEHGTRQEFRMFILVCGWGDNVCEYAFGFSTEVGISY